MFVCLLFQSPSQLLICRAWLLVVTVRVLFVSIVNGWIVKSALMHALIYRICIYCGEAYAYTIQVNWGCEIWWCKPCGVTSVKPPDHLLYCLSHYLVNVSGCILCHCVQGCKSLSRTALCQYWISSDGIVMKFLDRWVSNLLHLLTKQSPVWLFHQ